MKRVFAGAFVFILIAILGGWLYFYFPPKPEPIWDTSSEARIIVVGYMGEIDSNYIHDVQVWGDGHIIWVEHELGGGRRVLPVT